MRQLAGGLLLAQFASYVTLAPGAEEIMSCAEFIVCGVKNLPPTSKPTQCRIYIFG